MKGFLLDPSQIILHVLWDTTFLIFPHNMIFIFKILQTCKKFKIAFYQQILSENIKFKIFSNSNLEYNLKILINIRLNFFDLTINESFFFLLRDIILYVEWYKSLCAFTFVYFALTPISFSLSFSISVSFSFGAMRFSSRSLFPFALNV